MARDPRLLYGESRIVEVSCRVQHGRFLLTPSPEVNELVLGVLGRAQAKYDVLIHAFVFMSNHYHLLMSILRNLQMARFMGYVNGNLAKELGRHYDWPEKFWGKRYTSMPLGINPENQIRRLKYILSNGCKEGLVASPLEWPGVTSADALVRGETRKTGTWFDRTAEYRDRRRGIHRLHPSEEIVQLSPLPALADRSEAEQRQFVADAIKEIEEKTALMHAENGTEPLGALAIQRRNPYDKPKEFHPSPAPKFHAATPEEYWSLHEERTAKIKAYRDAAERLKQGDTDVEFPPGCFPPGLPYVDERGPP